MTAQSKMTAARTDLVLSQPFFGSLALSLKFKEDSSCETAYTDGRVLGYNPAFIDSLPHDKITALVAHEVFHCAMGHPWRREARDMKNWNIACDYSINSELKDSGFTLPAGSLFPSEPGKSAEWHYARVQQQPDNPQGNGTGQGPGSSPQAGKGTPDPLGEVRDAPTSADADGDPAPTEQEWKQKAAQAMNAAKMCGKLPGGLARTVKDSLKAKIDVRSLLMRFFSDRCNSDYSWSRPNSRYVASGLYLPALESRELGEIAIGIDTSGSVSAESLSYARSILESIIEELSPLAVNVYYFDSKVSSVDRFDRGDTLTWKPTGFGGTDFRPVLSEIEREGSAVCAVIITDLEGPFPETCNLPVIWLSTEAGNSAPFGEVVYLDR